MFVGALPVAAVGLRNVPSVNAGITVRLVLGAALFGAGWGLLGMCPGPALVYAGAWPNARTLAYFLAFGASGLALDFAAAKS